MRDAVYKHRSNFDRFGSMKSARPPIFDTMSNLTRILTVADLHQSARLYSQLAQAVDRHRPDVLVLLGDFLDLSGTGTGMLSVAACAHAIARMRVPEVVVVRGNHEGWNFLEFSEVFTSTGRQFRALHGEHLTHGQMTMIGFPCVLGDETAFTLHKRPLPAHPDGWLPKLVGKIGPAARTLWLMHEPPAGTPLSVSSGPIAGNREWTDAIHRFSPRLVICGHDHLTPLKTGRWHCRIGDTVVVNVGQPHVPEVHYFLVEALHAGLSLTATASIRLLSMHWNQTLSL